MSYLREIMQRISIRHAEGEEPHDLARSDESATGLISKYQDNLKACSQAMLDYEWAWLELHLEDLQLCRSNPTMLKAVGGERHLAALISEAEGCRQLLKDAFDALGADPYRHPHSVATGEHAWELTNPKLRNSWGLPASAP